MTDNNTVSSEQQLSDKILDQIEFYFSDSNLPRDNFLRTKVAEDPNGYVDLEIIASFKRVKEMSEDIEIIKKAVSQSDMLRLNEEGTRIKRTKPLPMTDTTDERSVYAKGFPTEEMSIDRLKKFFSTYGKVNCVRMRRFKNTHDLKPSAFIEFATEEEARALAEKTDLKFREEDAEPLKILMKKTYFEQKKTERDATRQKNKAEEAERKEKEMRDGLKFTEGCLVRVSGMGKEDGEQNPADDNKNNSKIEQFKEKFGKYGSVGFVDFDEADATRCTLRFNSAEDATKAMEGFGSAEEDRIYGAKPVLELISGEEEKDYYMRIMQQKSRKTMGGKKRKFHKKEGGNHKRSKK